MRANRSQACSIFGITKHQFDQFVADGLQASRSGAGRGLSWSVDTIVMHKWLVERELRAAGVSAETVVASASNVIDLNTERAKLAREQRVGHELKNAEARGELLPAPDVVEGWQAAIARARSLLLGIPPAAAEELMILASEGAAAVRERLADMIHAALSELANTEVEDVEDAA
jgi:phage terminase Nu1 subunit (DNA packaging protein)